MKDNKKKTENDIEAVDQYPGAAIDQSDGEFTDPKLVKERTKTLNNNPRNHDLKS